MSIATKTPNLFVSGTRWDRESVLALLPLIDCGATNDCGHNCCAEVVWIRVLDYEIDRIAQYTERSAKRLRGKWGHGGDDYRIPAPCEFWQQGQGCTIWPARPVACKYFPLARIAHEGQEVVGVTVEWCEAGRRCIEQLERWQGGQA